MIRRALLAAALLAGCGGIATEPNDAADTGDAGMDASDVCAIPLDTPCNPSTWIPTCCPESSGFHNGPELRICSPTYPWIQRSPHAPECTPDAAVDE